MPTIRVSKKNVKIKLGASSVYPALENLNIKPSEVQQIFNHPNSYGYDKVVVEAIEIPTEQCSFEKWYTEYKEFWDETLITSLTERQIKAVQNMILKLTEDLILEYDDEVLDIDFSIENNNLIVTNNVTGLDFNINNNGELEAIY